jgi:hypothetical protein
MAKTTIVKLVDDIDGSEAQNTVRFALDGVEWEIDLNSKHESELRTRLSVYLDAATRVRGVARTPRRGTSSTKGSRDRNADIRGWALSEGIELANRGRIARAVVEAFDTSDVEALYAAVGVEREPEPRTRGRKAARATFSEVA